MMKQLNYNQKKKLIGMLLEYLMVVEEELEF